MPSKQRSRANARNYDSKVDQKLADEDPDDIILDPESPMNSQSPKNVSGFALQQNPNQMLKVNQRHMKKQEVMRG